MGRSKARRTNLTARRMRTPCAPFGGQNASGTRDIGVPRGPKAIFSQGGRGRVRVRVRGSKNKKRSEILLFCCSSKNDPKHQNGAIFSVPGSWCPLYKAWALKRVVSTEESTEEPFSGHPGPERGPKHTKKIDFLGLGGRSRRNTRQLNLIAGQLWTQWALFGVSCATGTRDVGVWGA